MFRVLERLGCPVHIYGTAFQGQQGRLQFLPPSSLPFIEDLAGCRAVLSTAGNQLVGEAIYLGKPVLVMPERCVEQRLNAAAVERLGIGMQITREQFTTDRIRVFLGRLDHYSQNMRRHVRDGLHEALDAIETYLAELAPGAAPASEGFETSDAGLPEEAALS
jgi:UDP:flavonoid glycosyltransferase YjiC (YdhE family)